MKIQVSPQYLREENIYVTIIEVKTPVHYVIKESPSIDTASLLASKFLELEESMQNYYRSLEQTFFQLPEKDTILVVEHEQKYYRAKVCSVLNLPRSFLIKVYLLDYGKECSVSKTSLFEMHPDFMSIPFQAIDFKLPGLEPVSLVMNPYDLTINYGASTDWDTSAYEFIENIRKALHSVFIKVEGAEKNCIFGTLHVTSLDGEEQCINDELVFKKFASQNPECWNNITRLSEILSEDSLQSQPNISQGGSANLKFPESSCIIYKTSPASELSSVMSSVISNIESEPLKYGPKSIEYLTTEKSQERNKSSSSGYKEELPFQSNSESKYLKQKDLKNELKAIKAAELFEDIKDAFNTLNKAVKNSTEKQMVSTSQDTNKPKTVDKDPERTSNEIVLKTTNVNEYDQVKSASPNTTSLKRFKEMVARKRAAHKQNITQALADNFFSKNSELATDSPPGNACSSELERSVQLLQDLDISATQNENISDFLPSTTAYNEIGNTEKLVHQAMSPSILQVGIAVDDPSTKFPSKQSAESPTSPLEQKEISTKVDSVKIKTFYERQRKARAAFLAKNKSKQDQDNANSQLITAPSPSPNSSEAGTQLLATKTKNATELCGIASSTKNKTELAATITKNIVGKLYEDDSNINKVNISNESTYDSNKSVESEVLSPLKEVDKPKVDPRKIKAFFEQNRKARALFLAQAKSKQENESFQSEMTSPSSVACRPSEVESKSPPIITEIKNIDESLGNNSDANIFELANELSDSNSPKSERYAESETESLSLIQQEPVESVDFGGKSLFEKQKVPALCLGEGVPTPVLSLNEIAFHISIKKTLEKLNFEGPSCIQSIVWPAALRSRCLAAIAPPHSGKTVAYLLPIASNLLHGLYEDKGKGPIAIIICSSWRKVQHVYDLLHLFLDDSKFKILTYFADGKRKRNRVIALMNGCDILISVPSILLGFFNENSVCVNRCCHFILDDGANLLSSHINEIKGIMGMFGDAVKLRPAISARLQILINSERWTKAIAAFVDKFLHEPLLLFTSFLEAAIYAKIPIFPHICSESDKNQKLAEIVKECSKRTIVCTQDIKKAFEIHCFLQSEKIRSFLVTEKMEHYISDGIIRDWKCVNSGLPYCLIVTDPALTGMTLCDANYIIHYDVPEISRLQFGNRFGCIAEHFQNSKIVDRGCHILISEMCSVQALPIMKIIKRIGNDVTKELIDFINKQKKVVGNPNTPLCRFFKAFGFCKLPHCEKRHHINSVVDQPKVIFREGNVHAKITHMFDASHFCARVIKYVPPGCEQAVCLSSEYAEMGLKLKKFYSTESNRKVEDCPVIGGNYIIQYGNGFFYRVKVMNITRTPETNSQKITLMFRDDGFIQTCDTCELYKDLTCDELPPPHAVEIYLCNVTTPDSCLDWNPQANHFVKKLIMDKEIHGKIVLCLGETLWLHPMVLREKLAFNNDYLNVLTVDKSLRDAEFAMENEKHLPLLFKACQNKIQLPSQISSSSQEKIIHEDLKIQVSYAFLELNVYEDVYVSSVISPHQIYVQRVKFVDCLSELLEKINAHVEAKKLKKCSTLLNGMHCIAPFSLDNRYYRAGITSVSSDSDDVQLFFVDFGDSCCATKDSIFILPSEFTLLPFQAIECELDGIRAPHGGWSDKAADFLEDLTRDESNNMKIVELKAYTKLTSYDTGNRYKVDVWNGEKTLSEHLLKEGLVDPADKCVPVYAPSETNEDKEFVDDVPAGFSLSSDDEDLPLENKDHHALFCAALSKMMLQNMSNSEAVDEAISEMRKSKEERKFKLAMEEISVNGNVEEFVKEDITVVNSPVLALQRLLNYKKRKEVSKRITPKILWWDSSEHVHILLKLKEIQLYELDVKDYSFVFKTSLRDTDYYAEEQFYGAVHSNDFTEKNGSEGLSIVLKKQVEERWPRLIKENKKLAYIKYDLEHIDVSDSEDIPEESVEVAGEENSQVNSEMDYTFDEDSDSTDDENNCTRLENSCRI
ncbi:putative ATP-dependent RNA helicase TDRD12 like protein [Argiope bruennichi]|uniref:Probable ATP-dependent RNA helicase spindle-E n=1 Tax=Argiope bruennichi TaxID=94029 RepID=A0A8T0EGT4_ARGBR|nr:putative ATP-dependent RNA helicase TDRD12 like protein [Argiope bruennichi]